MKYFLGFAGVLFVVFWFLFPMNPQWLLDSAYGLLRGRVSNYPSMGYPAMFVPAIWLGLSPVWFMFGVQFIMCVSGVGLWWAEFGVPSQWYHVFAILPFVACMALMQTAAIPCFLVLVAVVALRHGKTWVAAVLVGICGLFRTELLILLPCLSYAAFKESMIVFALTVALLLGLTGSIMSSNTPAVFYGSLGQLEGNPWNLSFTDSCIERVAAQHGVDAWESPDLFTDLSIQAISSHPIWYVAKCVKNGLRAILTGPYIGEWRVKPYAWAVVVKYSLHVMFSGVMLWLIVKVPRWSFLGWAVLAFILAQALGNQMVRHWNVIYLPLLGVVLEARQ